MAETENTEPQSSEHESGKDQEIEWADELDANEINDILGFDLSAEDGDDRSGLRALINSALVSHRRLPMLEVIFDRTARQMTTSLRHLTNDNVEVNLDDVSSTRFGEFLGAMSSPAVIGVIKAEGLDNYCLIAIDSELVYTVVDVLLGGRRGGGVVEVEGRGFTQIELGLVQKILEIMAADFTKAFSPIADVSFSLERIETTARFAAIAQNANVCALAKFKIHIDERGGRAAILTPHATLEPIHKVLLQEFINETGAGQNLWREHLAEEIAAARLDLKVVLAEKEISIGDLGALEAGATIRFGSGVNRAAEIRAGNMVVAQGLVGRSGDAIAVRLEKDVNANDLVERVA